MLEMQSASQLIERLTGAIEQLAKLREKPDYPQNSLGLIGTREALKAEIIRRMEPHSSTVELMAELTRCETEWAGNRMAPGRKAYILGRLESLRPFRQWLHETGRYPNG